MDRITPKQKEYILSLLSKLPPETVKEISQQWRIENLDRYTKGQASNLIGVIHAHLKRGRR